MTIRAHRAKKMFTHSNDIAMRKKGTKSTKIFAFENRFSVFVSFMHYHAAQFD